MALIGAITTFTPFSALKAMRFPAPAAVAADRRCRYTALNLHAVVRAIASVQRAGDIGADVVALHDVVRRVDLDAFVVVRDHVAHGGSRSADRVTGARDDGDANVGVAVARSAIGVEADVVALDDVACERHCRRWSMPSSPLLVMTLRVMVAFEPAMSMPSSLLPTPLLPTPVVPVPAVPIQLSAIVTLFAPEATLMPSTVKPVIISPRIVLPPPAGADPDAAEAGSRAVDTHDGRAGVVRFAGAVDDQRLADRRQRARR